MRLFGVITVFFLLVVLSTGQDIIEFPIEECPTCDCTTVSKDTCASEEELNNPCSCCKKCQKGIGEACGGEDDRECADDLLCLPDDPYSANYNGKCYEITPCLTFGCNETEGECKCYYNNVCPIERLPFFTKGECEDAIKIRKCKEVVCPRIEETKCGEGMYFEKGPTFFDHCCPFNGRCVCNISQCTGPPDCANDTELVMTEEASHEEGKCCNEYKCKRTSCNHKGVDHSIGDTWTEEICATCNCTMEGVLCQPVLCPKLESCSISYVPEGKCCPVCFKPSDLFTPNKSTDCLSAVTNTTYSQGQTWNDTPCRTCTCDNGRIDCAEAICDAIICEEGSQEYYLPEGACCPACKDKTTPTVAVTLSPNTQPLSTESPSNDNNTPSDQESTQPPVASQIRNVALLMNIPYMEVKKQWNEFSLELLTRLNDKQMKVEDISITPDTSSTMNATIFRLKLDTTAMNESANDYLTSETDIAVIVNEMAARYDMATPSPATVGKATLPSSDMQLTATVIVLTLLAAVTLVSFIGVVIILVVINRQLKTVKTIRGIPTKPQRGGP